MDCRKQGALSFVRCWALAVLVDSFRTVGQQKQRGKNVFPKLLVKERKSVSRREICSTDRGPYWIYNRYCQFNAESTLRGGRAIYRALGPLLTLSRKISDVGLRDVRCRSKNPLTVGQFHSPALCCKRQWYGWRIEFLSHITAFNEPRNLSPFKIATKVYNTAW